jgi:hypothetical protein
LTKDWWFSPGTSSTTKTGRHDIAEILLKVALNTKIQIHSKTKVGGRLLFYQQKNEQILFHHAGFDYAGLRPFLFRLVVFLLERLYHGTSTKMKNFEI